MMVVRPQGNVTQQKQKPERHLRDSASSVPGWYLGAKSNTQAKQASQHILVTTTGVPQAVAHHPLRGFSAPPLGLLALSLFFLRRVSIQLELERVVKLERARELSRIFFPDIMSSPKPSWWEKA